MLYVYSLANYNAVHEKIFLKWSHQSSCFSESILKYEGVPMPFEHCFTLHYSETDPSLFK